MKFLWSFLAAGSLLGASIQLAWDPNPPEDSVASYSLHWGTNAGMYSQSLPVTDTNKATVDGLGTGTWFFALSATGSNGVSSLSDEVSFTVSPPPPVPARLRIITYVQGQEDGDSWKNLISFTSLVNMQPGTPYRSEVYSEFSKPGILKLSTFIQNQATNGSWINSTNLSSWTIMNTGITYRTLTFTEVLPQQPN